MPSRVQSSRTCAQSLNFRQPAEMDQPKDEDMAWYQSSVPKVSTISKENQDANGRPQYDWIAGVGDICCPVLDGRRSFSYNKSSKVEECDRQVTSVPFSPPVEISRKVTGPSKCPLQQNSTNKKRSALQRHCDFWDADQDGLIYPWDIFIGFRKLGFNIALCLWAAVTMCMCSSYSTQTGWIPHPMLAINLDKIDCCRHGSTTGAYDLDAELDPNRFDAIFRKYAEGKDYLTWRTMYNLWRGQCCANDFFGWFAGGLEWIAMYILLWPHDGRLRKEDIRGVYEGSIFFEIAEARARMLASKGTEKYNAQAKC
ncbi:hypothetical protein J1614_001063 [Plenodomus biglobosus]|nr:hypothetical protein J1614_001063 [Plenodomus biglobosus]